MSYAAILEKRDMLLREYDALRNKVAGLDIAIEIVAEELAASGMPLSEDPKGLRPQAGSPVGEAETPKGDGRI